MAYSTGFRKLELSLSQLTLVMYAVWGESGRRRMKVRLPLAFRLVSGVRQSWAIASGDFRGRRCFFNDVLLTF